jgi:3-deoxy-D-manno-octulosonic-acid transferase
MPMLVTNMTVTGAARVKAAFGNKVLQSYIPYDLPDAVFRFLKRTNPKIAIIMETELWPNLFAACKQRNVPIMLMNARLSEKSAKGYSTIRSLTDQMLNSIHTLAAQYSQDANRFITLGAPSSIVAITGNLKFDINLPGDLAQKSQLLHQQLGNDRLIWVAASTHPGEEEIILAAHRAVLEKIPSVLLILVPRHPERFDSVADLIQQKGFHIARRSKNDECTPQIQVYLGDTMGELLLIYSVADAAFVAGSFSNVGGHNMLEPAVLHKPVITGPQLFNFAEISRMLQDAKGMIIVKDANELSHCVTQLLQDTKYRAEIGENAYKTVEENRGALQKQVDLINSALQSR